jgi:hypothetical protein
VPAGGNPAFNAFPRDTKIDFVVGAFGDCLVGGDPRALAIVGVQKVAHVAARQNGTRRNVEDFGGSGRKRDDVGRRVPAPVAEQGGIESETQPFRV